LQELIEAELTSTISAAHGGITIRVPFETEAM
jgi:hypothetical protein